ncbi:MAG: hypothetical protein CME62_05355 [Halobacteriovoraceae bacterium]|nr:hypothetical protein [Halobacteriovoraceae bacterium]
MKIITLLLLVSTGLCAGQFEINVMEIEPDFALKFNLYNDQQTQQTAVLDCQSFFQKFDIFDKYHQVTHENFLTISECYKIYENTVNCLEAGHVKCIDSSDIFNNKCSCD